MCRVNNLTVCPFCGSESLSLYEDMDAPQDTAPWWELSIRCDNCGAQGPPTQVSKERAQVLWNARYEAPDE